MQLSLSRWYFHYYCVVQCRQLMLFLINLIVYTYWMEIRSIIVVVVVVVARIPCGGLD